MNKYSKAIDESMIIANAAFEFIKEAELTNLNNSYLNYIIEHNSDNKSENITYAQNVYTLSKIAKME